ncbi:MAG: MarR family transcriptional regulator [Marmoricola sp.]|nr:MarR family transcriptional regulator [Marmoricola sp.]
MSSPLNPDDDPWLSAEELTTWRLYRSVVLLVEDILEQQLRSESGITHQHFSVLVVLSDSPDQCLRMTDLAAQLTITRTRLTYVIQQMEKRGWVTRTDHPEDGRSHLVQLTAAGIDELAQVAPGHARTVKLAVFGKLSPEQVVALGEIYETVLQGIELGPTNTRLPWRR